MISFYAQEGTCAWIGREEEMIKLFGKRGKPNSGNLREVGSPKKSRVALGNASLFLYARTMNVAGELVLNLNIFEMNVPKKHY